MKYYWGIDLHSNNHVVAIIDDENKRVLDKCIGNDLTMTLSLLLPCRESLCCITVESTFNRYWLVDGLQEEHHKVQLVNTAAIKQSDVLKYSKDHQDAFHLAHLMRLAVLPTGYIYPKEQRAIRDLLRRRLSLVRSASQQLVSEQSQIWRSTGVRGGCVQLRMKSFSTDMLEGFTLQDVQAGQAVYQTLQQQVNTLEQTALNKMKLTDNYKIQKTKTGIGIILGLTIMLETGGIHRFKGAGNYAYYCRTVDSKRTSIGRTKGKGNSKAGNKYLSWALEKGNLEFAKSLYDRFVIK